MEYECVNCGIKVPKEVVVYYNNKVFCPRCAVLFNTCVMCVHLEECGFHNDPSPIPKQVRQQAHQGNTVIEGIGPNPERIKMFCTEEKCKCCDKEGPGLCNKQQFETCPNYEERDF